MARDTQDAETLAAIHRMEAALGRGDTDMTPYFAESFVWRGNRGCGVKTGLAAFRNGWQKPFRAAFCERSYHTERFIADGEWAAAYGYVEGTHAGIFMGIAPTGKRVRIPFMDFWHVHDGRIADNPVFVDFAEVLWQLGRDVFAGEGWEAYDDGRQIPPDDPTL
jgi:predicted ester cyclase